MANGDWNDVFEEVEVEHFVGREQELESFRQHIRLAKPRFLIFYITGQGGAGKSTLLIAIKKSHKGMAFFWRIVMSSSTRCPQCLVALLSN